MAIKAKNQNNTWWIILVVVLFLGAGGYGGYRYWKSKQQPTKLAKGSDVQTIDDSTEREENPLEETTQNSANTAGKPAGSTVTKSAYFSKEMAEKIKKIAALDVAGEVKYNDFATKCWNSYAKLSAGAIYEKGDKYAAVACIQKILSIEKFYTGKIDGIWGSGTDKAVAKFCNAQNGKMNKKYSIKMLEYTGENAFNGGYEAVMTWYAM
jgi:hypothetical protein